MPRKWVHDAETDRNAFGHRRGRAGERVRPRMIVVLDDPDAPESVALGLACPGAGVRGHIVAHERDAEAIGPTRVHSAPGGRRGARRSRPALPARAAARGGWPQGP